MKEGTKPRRRAGANGAAMLVAFVMCAASAVAQTSRPSADRPPSIRDAMRMLTDEAKAAKQEGRLTRERADFADDFAHALPAEIVADRIARRASSDSFIDAYVRWQLTSFDGAALPEMRDRAFLKFIATLPKFNANPRADRAMLARMDAMRRMGQLRGRDEVRINTMIADLNDRSAQADRLNRPAEAFRDWVTEQLDTSERRLTASLERCAALVDAGWNVEQLKLRVHTTFADAAADEAFTDAERERVAARARRLIGMRRAYLARGAIENGAITMQIDEAAVYDFEVARWIRAMRREPDQ